LTGVLVRMLAPKERAELASACGTGNSNKAQCDRVSMTWPLFHVCNNDSKQSCHSGRGCGTTRAFKQSGIKVKVTGKGKHKASNLGIVDIEKVQWNRRV